MIASRGRCPLSAAFLLLAGLLPFLAVSPAPAEPLPVPRFESADCPFEVPEDARVRFGRLVVPAVRPYEPGDTTISIAVLVLGSRSQNPRPDPVLYLEGGPGGPSLAYFDDWIASPILDHREIILFDQRGVGYSSPDLPCPEIRTARQEADGPGFSDAEAVRRMLESARTCAARLEAGGIDLAAFNTAESARDLADLRQVLGIAEWNLYGISYGTRLALRVMHEDPEGIRSVVLDSVVDPAADEYGSAPGNARSAFGRLMDAVEADPLARCAFPGLRGLLEETASSLDRDPRIARIRLPGGKAGTVRIGGDALYDAIYSFLYDPDSIPYLPLFIRAVASGDVSHLAMFAEDLLYDDLSDGLYYALQGHDEAPFTEVSADPGGGYDPLRLEREMALAFGSGRADWVANAPLESDIPALVLAGGFDPITPAEGSRRVAERMTKGTFLLFPGLGHAVSMSSGPESLVAAFFEDPSGKPDAGGMPENRIRPFATRLFVTAVPYRLHARVVFDRDPDTLFSILAFAGAFLAGSLSLAFTWRDRRRPGASRCGVAARLAGGIGAFLNAGCMAALFWAVAFVNRTEPAMLFFGLPPGVRFLPWLARAALPAGVLLVFGLPFLFRDRGVSGKARVFFLVLALAELLFFLLLARWNFA
jgi:pimeloyl-ACP methyl ester carboxylesterase